MLASRRGLLPLLRPSRHAAALRCRTSSLESSSAAMASFAASSELATQLVAEVLAQERRAGDCYLLFGAVGAGKSTFSRAFIRAAAGDPHLTVPSPTFLLQQIYDEQQGPPIHHLDLYRLTPGSDLGRLELGASFSSALCLVEWPERLLCSQLPLERLEVTISIMQHDQQQRLEQQRRLRAAEAGGAGRPQDHGSEGAAFLAGVESECEGGEEDPYADERWRVVQLQAVGARWQQRLPGVVQQLAQVGPQLLSL